MTDIILVDYIYYRLTKSVKNRNVCSCCSKPTRKIYSTVSFSQGSDIFYFARGNTDMEYTKERVELFKRASGIFLQTISVKELQTYARMLNLKEPTKLKKRALIAEIVGVHCGEIIPPERSNRGAPIKNGMLNPVIVERMELFKKKILVLGEEVESVSEQEPPEKEETQTPPVTLKIEVLPSALTSAQRKLFNAFINSL